MNVLFININQLSNISSTDTVPLIPGYIIAYLKANGHDGYILDDVKDKPLSLQTLNQYFQKNKPDIVGFSAYHYQMERVRFFARFIKRFYPETIIVLGGPQALFLPPEALYDLEDFDIICNRGEGEVTILALAECLKNNTSFSNVEGIAYRDGKKAVNTPMPKCLPEDLDIYPSPYIAGTINLAGKTMASILTSRGCEHVCNFCVTPFFNKRRVRFHSIEHVIEEMEFLQKKGIQRLWIADPNFTSSRERTVSLMEAKIKKGIKTPFWCQTRVDQVDEELLDLMQRAGLYCVGFGFEAGSDTALETMHKGVRVDRFHQMVTYAQSIGLEVELFCMYGQPGETVEDARKTLEVVRKYKIPIFANSYAQRLQVTAGSVYGKNPEAQGFKLIEKYRPRYLSVWHDYETDVLKEKDFDKIHALWTLYNAEIEYNLKNKINLFHAIDFLMEYREDLKKEKHFYEMGVYLSSLFEDYDMLNMFVSDFVKEFSPDKKEIFNLLSNAEIYEKSQTAVDEKSRVVIFCEFDKDFGFESLMVKPGLNLLSFDNPKDLILGMQKGEVKVVKINDNLSLKVTILDIYKRKTVKTLKELKSVNIAHGYGYITIEMLERSQNELLLFLALKNMDLEKISTMPAVFLNLISFYAKMHKFKEIDRCLNFIMQRFHDPKRIAEAVADVVSYAGRYEKALSYYAKASNSDDVLIKKANALNNLKRYDDAYAVLENVKERNSFNFKKTLLESLKVAKKDEVELIKEIDKEVLNMLVDMAFNQNGSNSIKKAYSSAN